MPQTGLRPPEQRLPPALNIIALATFAASLSARALDPVLPHVAERFRCQHRHRGELRRGVRLHLRDHAAGAGAAADLFGKARLMIVCLVLLGVANILGALSTSFSMLFATRILAGIGSGGVFPIALGLTSDLVGPEKRQVAIGRTLAGVDDRQSARRLALRPDRRFPGLARRAGGAWLLVVVASVAVAIGFRGAALTRAPAKVDLVGAQARLSHHLHQSECARSATAAVFIEGCCVLGLFPYVAAFLFELGETSLSIAGIVIAGFAVGGLFYT